MKLIIKCWETKAKKVCKALFYETDKGCFLLSFDKFAIIALIGVDAYRKLEVGDIIIARAIAEGEIYR